jgi:hypothetical protein
LKIKELECIKRLVQKGYYHEIANWLIESKFIHGGDIQTLSRDLERAEFIYRKLKHLEEEGKLLLLDFEWQILPLEFIKLMCTTEHEEKLFTYGL